MLRVDSGFSDAAFLGLLEDKALPYIVKLNQPLQRALVGASGWWRLDTGIDLVSFNYQPDAWEKPRRVVGIRQQIATKPDAKGKQLSLFAEDEVIRGSRYAVLVTHHCHIVETGNQSWRFRNSEARLAPGRKTHLKMKGEKPPETANLSTTA